MNTRNKPCACGSGKKSKRCCGNEAERARVSELARQAVWEHHENRRRRMISSENMEMAAVLSAAAGLQPHDMHRRF